MQVSAADDKVIEIGHGSVLPQVWARVTVCIYGYAGDLSSIVDGCAETGGVSGQHAKISHLGSLFSPQKSVPAEAIGHGSEAGNLTGVVDGEADVLWARYCSIDGAAQVAKIMDRPVLFPQYGVRSPGDWW